MADPTTSPVRGWKRRRPAVAWGLVVVAVYAALAAWSGHLSPLARRPLLDGLVPGAAYRWVTPPPDLTSTNVPPSPGDFELKLGGQGSLPDVLVTQDNQVTIVAEREAVESRPGQTAARLRVDPVDPATLAPPPGELVPFGNAYRIRASYEPSGDAVARFRSPPTLILVYPATPNLHSTDHVVLFSNDGSGWNELDTKDALAQQQAEVRVDEPGHVMVAAVPAAIPSPPATQSTEQPRTLSTVLFVAAGCSLLIGIGLLLRGRRAE